MFVVEKDGRQRHLANEVQLAAYLNSGWRVVSQEPRADAPPKKPVAEPSQAELGTELGANLGPGTVALPDTATAPKRGRK